MKLFDALKFVRKHYKNQTSPDAMGDAISAETFIEVLDVVESQIPLGNKKSNERLEGFLWAGCRKFNRWFVPSPYVVPEAFAATHARFVSALVKVERGLAVNAPVFQIHAVRDRLYHSFNLRPLPLGAQDLQTLSILEANIEEISIPENDIKRQECLREKVLVKELFRGLREGDLQTLCRFSIPYPLLKEKVQFRAIWQDIVVEGRLTPVFSDRSEFMTRGMPPTVMLPRVPTRWQFGVTQVELDFKALVDHSAQVAPLQLPMEPLPVMGWPCIFRSAFQLLYELYWPLRQRHNFIGSWTPSPADLGDLEYCISTKNDPKINSIRKSNPAIGSIGFNPNSAVTDVVDFGKISPTPWHGQCRILAVQYLELGETREAMFWINVGVESLLKLRMETLAIESGTSMDNLDPAGTASYWDDAKALVGKQFPEIVDRINWPSKIPIPAGMFRRLKYFCKRIKLAKSVDEIISKYSHIQKDRNALFHGEAINPIDPTRVRLAIESFDWLVENFQAA